MKKPDELSFAPPLGIPFCQIEIVLKDSTAFVYVTTSVWLNHFT